MKNQKLYTQFKKFQKVSLLLILFSACSFVFFNQIFVALCIFLIAIISEIKFYRCPHCDGTLDPRKKMEAETSCPRCGMSIFTTNNMK